MRCRAMRLLCAALIVLCLLPAQGLAAPHSIMLLTIPPGSGNVVVPVQAEAGTVVNILITVNPGWYVDVVGYALNTAPTDFYPVTWVNATHAQFTMPDVDVSVSVGLHTVSPAIAVQEGGTEIPYGGSLTLEITNAMVYTNPTFLWLFNAVPDYSKNATTLTITEPGYYQGGVILNGVDAYSDMLLITAEQPSNLCDILQFTIPGQVGATEINGTDITVTMPNGTDVTGLMPTVVVSDLAQVTPASLVAQDFSLPVSYVVTAQSGARKIYQARVVVQPSPDKEITSFTIPAQVNTTQITGLTIELTMPYGTDLGSLVPAITHTGVSIAPGTGRVQDFSAPVQYVVTAADGSKATYTVYVDLQGPGLSSDREITSFTIPGQLGQTVIFGTSINLMMPYGTDLRALVPTIVHTGDTIAPQSGMARDFTDPVVYVVTAQDGQTASYIATVSLGNAPPPAEGAILSFTIPGQVGATAITGTTIAVTMPDGTDVTALSPAIKHTGTGIVPASGAAQDFTSPVTYTLTRTDGSTLAYTATVTVQPATPGPPEPPTPPVPPATEYKYKPEKLVQPAKTFQKGRVINVSEYANVREAPSTDSPLAGRAYLDEIVDLLEWTSDGQWCHIRFDGSSRIGWMHRRFIQPL